MPEEPTSEEQRRLLEHVFARIYRRRLRVPAPPPFLDPRRAGPDGVVGLGAELTPELVLAAYRQGIFPMADRGRLIGWWSPDPRTILDLDRFHVPRRLARTVRQGRFEVRVDAAFDDVIRACADRSETWISERFIAVYGELHRRGRVHSVETWREGRLVGGLYGVSLGGAFMAESMFHLERDASKVAVVGLVERMRARGLVLLDIQYETRATSIFRPVAIPRAEFLGRLEAALVLDASFGDEEA